MLQVILLTVFISALGQSQGKVPFYPMQELQNIEEVVSSVGGIAEGYFPMASASESLPRVARQAQPLMPYRYGYAVQDDIGNDFNQQEQSDGAQVTGQYSVLLPDGRIQTVTYSVRPETGFVRTSNLVRGAIPVLDHRSAALCLVLNCLCPGSGTLLSGIIVVSRCSSSLGPRWGERPDTFDRVCCLLVNLIIALAQLVSVPLCLVGWCWSIGWGVTIINIANRQLKYEAVLRLRKSIQDSEQKTPEPLKIDVMSLEGYESF